MTATFLTGQVLTAAMLNNAFSTKLDETKGAELSSQVDKTAIFYNTVADMVADTMLKAGKAVITHGYWSANDGGGARYLIKDTATDYSIPVANGLHAVFADSFDIRRFGIRDSATLDQTTEIERMCRYADISGTYEIDFLGYSLQVPKTRTMTTQWGIEPYGGVMGMAFEKVHKLKNLFIAHDKTVRLENCMCMILFTPLADAPYEQWFKLDNVTFDAWVDNYQPVTDNYLGNGDGFRQGFIAVPKKGAVGIVDSSPTPSNYSFEFSNIHFKSPAYSYNLIPAIHAKNIRFSNLTGDYLGLYLLHICKKLVGNNMQTVYRDDLREANRTIVTNTIHAEAEFGGKPNTRSLIDVSNISSIKKSTGKPHSAFVFMDLGVNTIDTMNLEDMQGYVGLYGDTTVTNVNYLNCIRPNGLVMAGEFKVNGTMFIKNWKLFKDAPQGSFLNPVLPIWNHYIKKMVIEDSDIDYAFSGGYVPVENKNIDELVLDNVQLSDTFINDQNLTIKKITASNVRLTDNFKEFIKCKFETADLSSITYSSVGTIFNLLENTGSNTATANINNVNSPRQLEPYRSLFYGLQTVNLKNSNFADAIEYGSSKVTLNIENTKFCRKLDYDPPSLATATQQSNGFRVAGARIGNGVVVSFDKTLQGTRMWGEVTDVDSVTVYHRNDTGVTVDLPNGTLTIKVI